MGVPLKKTFAILFAVVIAAAMAALAWYSLQDREQRVVAREYGGDFAYTGSLRNGRFDYRGEAIFADGARFKGYFSNGRVFAGYYTPVDDWRFEGQFRDGKVGGSFFLPGDVTATFSPKMDDTAEFASPKGWEYAGGLGERGQNGEGTFNFPGGESYTGGFLLGLADDQGTYRDAQGNVVYEGGWKAGLYHGEGRYSSPDGSFVYAGAFEAGLPHGEAAYWEGQDLRYKGDFVGGVPEGQGTYYSPAGWTYEGSFKSGVFHGEGVLTKAGASVKGVWEKGKQVSREE